MMMGSTQQIEAVTSSLGASARNLAACSVVTSPAPPSSQAQKDSRQNEMSMRFRILKSLLLVAAWISFGMNFEVIGSTLEDLKLYLNVDYHSVSFGLTLRNIGYLVMVSFSGYLFDRFPRYADLVMCLSSLLIAIRKCFFHLYVREFDTANDFLIVITISRSFDPDHDCLLGVGRSVLHSRRLERLLRPRWQSNDPLTVERHLSLAHQSHARWLWRWRHSIRPTRQTLHQIRPNGQI